MDQGLSFLGPQVDGDRLFVAVDAQEIGTLGQDTIGGVLVGGKGRAPRTGIIAALGVLDLDDFGSVIRFFLGGKQIISLVNASLVQREERNRGASSVSSQVGMRCKSLFVRIVVLKRTQGRLAAVCNRGQLEERRQAGA